MVSGLALVGSGLLVGCSTPPGYASGEAARREAALPANAPTLFYVTNRWCSFCAAFQATYMPTFEQSKERERLRFVTLHSPNVSLPQQYPWAEQHAWAPEAARSHGLLMQTPLFVLIREHRYITAGFGIEDWKTEILPAVHKEVSTA
jgi:thiol-disulfide isomerase/thioredoxin